MKYIKVATVITVGFFSPTLLIMMMFNLFGLNFQPDAGGAIILTVIGFAMSCFAYAMWDDAQN